MKILEKVNIELTFDRPNEVEAFEMDLTQENLIFNRLYYTNTINTIEVGYSVVIKGTHIKKNLESLLKVFEDNIDYLPRFIENDEE